MRHTLRRQIGLLVIGATAAALLAACGGSNSTTAAELGEYIPLPAATFTDTSNTAYNITAESKSHMTIVYFGYTNCPDICPTTMANLGGALKSLPTSISDKVQVLFITSDPARDTTTEMSEWLSHFDMGLPLPFIGLRTTVAAVDAYGAKIGVPLEPPVVVKGVDEVTHGDQTLIFAAGTELSHYVWVGPATTAQYAADIRTFATKDKDA